jgi:hypothetical protein
MSKLKQEEMKFQLFLKENDNKRQRAVKRAQDEKNIRDAKEKELELLRIEMKDTEAKLVLSKANLDAGLVYQTYLEEVVCRIARVCLHFFRIFFVGAALVCAASSVRFSR